ncbi:MAG: hypothetical protein ABI724_09155 [Betaproteobacteria bacterium]
MLLVLLAGPALAHEGETPAYRPPLLLTVHDSQVPGVECTAAAIKGGEAVMVPLTLLASACATWTNETCEIWAPQTGLAVLWGVASSLMTPDMILGHEATHCWLHDFHGVLPWF